MNRVTALVGITVLAVLAGCAKKESPQAQEEDGGATATATQPEPAAAKPVAKDRSKAATAMLALMDTSPQCQQYRDQLETMGKTPGVIDELSGIYVQAHTAGCIKKKQNQ
jgi:hypothetical protein